MQLFKLSIVYTHICTSKHFLCQLYLISSTLSTVVACNAKFTTFIHQQEIYPVANYSYTVTVLVIKVSHSVLS